MKNSSKLCLALLLALPLAACGEKSAADTMKGAASSATAKIDEMKASFTKLTEGQMGDVTKSIEELTSKASTLTGDKKTEVDGLLKNIMTKKDDLMKMFTDMKGMAGGAGFDGMKDKLTNGIGELKKLVEAAMAKLK